MPWRFLAFRTHSLRAEETTRDSETRGAGARTGRSRHSGSESYTPTKREWLLLCLVQDKTIFDLANPGDVQFIVSADDDDPDTIAVLVTCAKSATKDAVDTVFDIARFQIRQHAMKHGRNWVKVRRSEMALPESHMSQ